MPHFFLSSWELCFQSSFKCRQDLNEKCRISNIRGKFYVSYWMQHPERKGRMGYMDSQGDYFPLGHVWYGLPRPSQFVTAKYLVPQ